MVKVVIGNVDSRIVGYLPPEVHKSLDRQLSFWVPGAIHTKAYKDKRWDGKHHLYKKTHGQSFMSGLISLVTKVLKYHKIQYQLLDARKRPEPNRLNLSFHPPEGFEERGYQTIAREQSIKKGRGIIKIATGGGKTMVVSTIIGDLKTVPFNFYVTTKDLLEQAHEVLSETLKIPIGKVGGGEFDIKDVNVCMVQTAVKSVYMDKAFNIKDYSFDEEDTFSWKDKDVAGYDNLRRFNHLMKECKGFFFDEAHHAASRTIVDILRNSPNAYYRYGGSATPYREDNADLILQGSFGQKIIDVNASYLIDNGWLAEPSIIFERIEHDCNLNAYQSIYSECVTRNDEFNAHVSNTAKYLIENNLSSLILVQHYPQGDMIKKMIGGDVEFVTGKMSSKKRKKAIKDLKEKRKLAMIATTLADEGLDIPTLDAALLAGGGASASRVNQRIGRTLRIDRKSSYPRDKSVVVCYDHDVKYLKDHAKKTRKILMEEPRFKILESNGGDFIKNEISSIFKLGTPSSIFDML